MLKKVAKQEVLNSAVGAALFPVQRSWFPGATGPPAPSDPGAQLPYILNAPAILWQGGLAKEPLPPGPPAPPCQVRGNPVGPRLDKAVGMVRQPLRRLLRQHPGLAGAEGVEVRQC